MNYFSDQACPAFSTAMGNNALTINGLSGVFVTVRINMTYTAPRHIWVANVYG